MKNKNLDKVIVRKSISSLVVPLTKRLYFDLIEPERLGLRETL